jgi:hypothetical protein
MPDEELKQLLKQNLEVSQENLKILHKINRGRKISSFLIFIKWVIIIGVALGAFYYLEPYTNNLKSFYGDIENLQNLQENINLPNINK